MFVKQEPFVFLRSICWINKISGVPFAHWKLTNALKMAICQELYEAEFIPSKWTNWNLLPRFPRIPAEPVVQKKWLKFAIVKGECAEKWWGRAAGSCWGNGRILSRTRGASHSPSGWCFQVKDAGLLDERQLFLLLCCLQAASGKAVFKYHCSCTRLPVGRV